jgi:hypothetical protein
LELISAPVRSAMLISLISCMMRPQNGLHGTHHHNLVMDISSHRNGKKKIDKFEKVLSKTTTKMIEIFNYQPF